MRRDGGGGGRGEGVPGVGEGGGGGRGDRGFGGGRSGGGGRRGEGVGGGRSGGRGRRGEGVGEGRSGGGDRRGEGVGGCRRELERGRGWRTMEERGSQGSETGVGGRRGEGVGVEGVLHGGHPGPKWERELEHRFTQPRLQQEKEEECLRRGVATTPRVQEAQELGYRGFDTVLLDSHARREEVLDFRLPPSTRGDPGVPSLPRPPPQGRRDEGPHPGPWVTMNSGFRHCTWGGGSGCCGGRSKRLGHRGPDFPDLLVGVELCTSSTPMFPFLSFSPGSGFQERGPPDPCPVAVVKGSLPWVSSDVPSTLTPLPWMEQLRPHTLYQQDVLFGLLRWQSGPSRAFQTGDKGPERSPYTTPPRNSLLVSYLLVES